MTRGVSAARDVRAIDLPLPSAAAVYPRTPEVIHVATAATRRRKCTLPRRLCNPYYRSVTDSSPDVPKKSVHHPVSSDVACHETPIMPRAARWIMGVPVIKPVRRFAGMTRCSCAEECSRWTNWGRKTGFSQPAGYRSITRDLRGCVEIWRDEDWRETTREGKRKDEGKFLCRFQLSNYCNDSVKLRTTPSSIAESLHVLYSAVEMLNNV